MSFESKHGILTQPTSAGTQVITGLGFEPKAIIFFGSRNTSTGTTANIQSTIGFATASAERGTVWMSSEDNAGIANAYADYRGARSAIFGSYSSSTREAELWVESLDSDGFTANWLAADATQRTVSYLAIGGSSVKDAYVSVFEVASSTGSQSITSTGFTPNCVLFGTKHYSERGFGFGAMTSTDQFSSFVSIDDGAAISDTGRAQTSASCIQLLSDPGTVGFEASYMSFDADGFTLDVTTSIGLTNNFITFLALDLDEVDIGTFNQPTSTGSQSITGAGFEPQALLLSSFGRSTTSGGSTNARLSLGMADGTDQSYRWIGDADALATTNTNSIYENTKVLGAHHSTTMVNQAEASLTTFDSDGFTLNWSTADSTPREIFYITMGGPDAFGESRDATMTGSDLAGESVNATLTGGEVSADSISATMVGSERVSSTVQASMAGSDADSGDVSAHMVGGLESSRNVTLLGGLSDTRSATLTGSTSAAGDRWMTMTGIASKDLADTVTPSDTLEVVERQSVGLDDSVITGDSLATTVKRGLNFNGSAIPKPHGWTPRKVEDGVFHVSLTGTKTWDVTSITNLHELAYEIADFENPEWNTLLNLYYDHITDGTTTVYVVWDAIGLDSYCLLDFSPVQYIKGLTNKGTLRLVLTEIQ